VAEAVTEGEAREAALRSALKELDLLCERSSDCRDYELNLEPLRSDCQVAKSKSVAKCYRAVQTNITQTKRETPYAKGKSLQQEIHKLEVTARIDPQDLETLRQALKNPNPVSAPSCPKSTADFQKAMLDFSTPEKREGLVNEALKVPYTRECAAPHKRLMYLLRTHHVILPEYLQFIAEALSTIEEPGRDDRAEEVLSYLGSAGPMSDAHFELALNLVRRADRNALYRLLPRFSTIASRSQPRS
jgi:hypothetical protein